MIFFLYLLRITAYSTQYRLGGLSQEGRTGIVLLTHFLEEDWRWKCGCASDKTAIPKPSESDWYLWVLRTGRTWGRSSVIAELEPAFALSSSESHAKAFVSFTSRSCSYFKNPRHFSRFHLSLCSLPEVCLVDYEWELGSPYKKEVFPSLKKLILRSQWAHVIKLPHTK